MKVRANERRQDGDTPACSIGCRIEADTNEKLEAICFREGISKSALIRRLIRQFVEENEHE